MNRDVLRAAKKQLEAELDSASNALRSIKGVGSGLMGLTPDSVKQSQEFIDAKNQYDRAFAQLRAFNGRYGKELRK